MSKREVEDVGIQLIKVKAENLELHRWLANMRLERDIFEKRWREVCIAEQRRAAERADVVRQLQDLNMDLTQENIVVQK
jgi:hypothetical protein